MRRWLVLLLFVSVPAMFFVAASLKAEDGTDKGVIATPLMRQANPDAAKAGDTVTVIGEYLDTAHVAEVYLTAGELTIKVEVLSQEASKLRFVVPKADPGRLRLMVLSRGTSPLFIEQPVMLQIL